MRTRSFKIKDIFWNLNNYPREAGPDWHAVMDIVSAIKVGERMPPPTLATVDGKLEIVDGWHRIRAFKTMKLKQIQCEYLGVLSQVDAFAEAVRRNISHGKKLSWHEKLLAYQKLREANWTLQAIERIVHVPAMDLKRLAAGRIIKTTGGEEVVLKSAIQHLTVNGRRHTSVELDSQAKLATSRQLDLVTQLIILIKNRWLNRRDKQLNKQLRELYLLLRPLVKQEIHV